MADRCVFFDDLVRVDRARQRTYVLLDAPRHDLTCVDARQRIGPDWWFARTWVPTRDGPRALYRTLDRLETRGFRFRVAALAPGHRSLAAHRNDPPAAPRTYERASRILQGLDEEERRLHRELFPEEADLLTRGYDWDHLGVYKQGRRLPADAVGRVLDRDGHVIYEWVPVADEFTWRRYPLGRERNPVTVPRT